VGFGFTEIGDGWWQAISRLMQQTEIDEGRTMANGRAIKENYKIPLFQDKPKD